MKKFFFIIFARENKNKERYMELNASLKCRVTEFIRMLKEDSDTGEMSENWGLKLLNILYEESSNAINSICRHPNYKFLNIRFITASEINRLHGGALLDHGYPRSAIHGIPLTPTMVTNCREEIHAAPWRVRWIVDYSANSFLIYDLKYPRAKPIRITFYEFENYDNLLLYIIIRTGDSRQTFMPYEFPRKEVVDINKRYKEEAAHCFAENLTNIVEQTPGNTLKALVANNSDDINLGFNGAFALRALSFFANGDRSGLADLLDFLKKIAKNESIDNDTLKGIQKMLDSMKDLGVDKDEDLVRALEIYFDYKDENIHTFLKYIRSLACSDEKRMDCMKRGHKCRPDNGKKRCCRTLEQTGRKITDYVNHLLREKIILSESNMMDMYNLLHPNYYPLSQSSWYDHVKIPRK